MWWAGRSRWTCCPAIARKQRRARPSGGRSSLPETHRVPPPNRPTARRCRDAGQLPGWGARLACERDGVPSLFPYFCVASADELRQLIRLQQIGHVAPHRSIYDLACPDLPPCLSFFSLRQTVRRSRHLIADIEGVATPGSGGFISGTWTGYQRVSHISDDSSRYQRLQPTGKISHISLISVML